VTAPGGTPGPASSTALARELRDFLIQFSIALHRFGMYPDGHPSLEPTVERVEATLAELLFSRATLSLGVARAQLIIEGVATDPKNPVLMELAARLHRHHLGAISFQRGVTVDELYAFFRLVAQDPERAGGAIGLDPGFRTKIHWPNLAAYPLNYERLQFTQDDAQLDETETSRATRTRSAQLWLGLARAAMAVGALDAVLGEREADALADTDPEVVARAIDGHQRDHAYDQVIVGYMLQIADELKSGQAAESVGLRKRVSELVSRLERTTLTRLLEMGGDAAQRRRFLLSASEGMAVDAVVDLVRAAGSAGEQTVSHSLLRMLQKLARHAEHGAGRRRLVADESIRDQIRQLIEGWSLRDPNPDAYRQALQRMSTSAPAFVTSSEAQFSPEPRRLVEMALELDTVGEPVDRAVDELVNRGELPWVLETLRFAYAPTAVDALRRRVARDDRIATVLSEDPINFPLLDELVAAFGPKAADPLLDGLAAAESSATRRALITRIVALGAGVEPAILQRLGDHRWYVVRNMLSLLGELPALPEGFDPGDHLQHSDGRVRREAMRLSLRDAATRDRAIMAGLRDQDDHVVRLALTAAGLNCPEAAVPLLVTRAISGSNTDQRVAAIRVLGETRHPSALSTLLRVAAPRRGLLGPKPPSKTPEYLAALTGLQRYLQDPRAREALAVAAQSRDRDVVRAAQPPHPEDR
jgi:hypothetical protein